MAIVIKKNTAAKIKMGYPLIREDDVSGKIPAEKDWIDFVDTKGQFLGRGYLGDQNKGVGWVLTTKKEPLNQGFFVRLFAEAKQKRYNLLLDELTTAFRIFNGEGDGLGGLTIDWYAGFAVFSWYNEAIYQHAELLLAAFQEVYPEVQGASEKIRFKSDLPESSWLFGQQPAEPLIVQENGVNYATYLDEGLMTGIFLDQKDVRNQLVQGLAAGKTVLNMFSYTGAFSVAAAMGGAAETTSVDLAKRSRSKTEEQFMVNGLPLNQQKIIVMDTFEYFKYAKRKGFTYDLIILDPPSFARNKKKVFTVAKNYGELIAESLPLLNPKGRIVASTNAENLSLKKFQEMVEEEFLAAGANFTREQVFRLPNDFQTKDSYPEGNYLKVLFYKIH